MFMAPIQTLLLLGWVKKTFVTKLHLLLPNTLQFVILTALQFVKCNGRCVYFGEFKYRAEWCNYKNEVIKVTKRNLDCVILNFRDVKREALVHRFQNRFNINRINTQTHIDR